jgi:hypothetical protein
MSLSFRRNARAAVIPAFLVAPLLGGCLPPAADEADAISCEGQGFPPGTNGNMRCALGLAEARADAGLPPLTHVASPPVTPPPPDHPGSVPQTVTVIVPPRKTSTINFSTYLDRDCRVVAPTVAAIGKQPEHGTAKILDRQDYPRYPFSSAHAACNKIRVAGIALDYTPGPNFVGTDFIEYRVKSNPEESGTFKFTIDVREPPLDDRLP